MATETEGSHHCFAKSFNIMFLLFHLFPEFPNASLASYSPGNKPVLLLELLGFPETTEDSHLLNKCIKLFSRTTSSDFFRFWESLSLGNSINNRITE